MSKKTCTICGRACSDFQGQECPVCGKYICFKCSEEHCTSIDLEDFQYQFICDECMTDKLTEVIQNAEYTQAVMNTAQSNHYKACETILDEISKTKENKNESKIDSNDTRPD